MIQSVILLAFCIHQLQPFGTIYVLAGFYGNYLTANFLSSLSFELLILENTNMHSKGLYLNV